VEDDGPGIPQELRGRVFERFVRGAGDRGGSFGLGLSIVRAVAESHGGRVRVESPTANGRVDAGGRPGRKDGDDPPHGTRFVVTLPAAA
jgi:signal transduction histidine kinase